MEWQCRMPFVRLHPYLCMFKRRQSVQVRQVQETFLMLGWYYIPQHEVIVAEMVHSDVSYFIAQERHIITSAGERFGCDTENSMVYIT